MKLYLVQHGEAVAKDVDPGRPLSPQGEQDVQQIADSLKNMRVFVSKIVHSGKVRAEQTAEILAEAILSGDDCYAIKGIDPKDTVEPLAKSVHTFKDDTMLVGHLPFMAKLVSHLVTGKDEPALVHFRPGSVVCLEQDDEQLWQIQWMVRPNRLM